MKKALRVSVAVFALALNVGAPAAAQAPNAAMLAEQTKAMAALSFLDGEWAGPAAAHGGGGIIKMTQTERSGPLLGGTIRLVEGRSYDAAGRTLFNAFAVISYDIRTKRYLITSHASGYSTSTVLTLTGTGFEWEVPAGPQARMHFKAIVQNGRWTETGELIGPSGPPQRTFEMTVRRLRPTKWPAGAPALVK